MAPTMIRIANWPFNSVAPERSSWTQNDWLFVVLKWPFSCLGLSIAFLKPTYTFSYWPSGNRYPPLTYKYWGYPKVSRNIVENDQVRNINGSAAEATNPVAERPLNPRLLWVQDPENKKWERVVVEQYLAEHDSLEQGAIEYVLVAYTTNQFDHDSQADMNALHKVARQAALDAGVYAYWCGDTCMSKDPVEMEKDVYRISDVIRSAYSISIALKRPNNGDAVSDSALLKDWGSRMWTLPEALLAPKEQPINIYNAASGKPHLVQSANRRNLPSLLWSDSDITRQLVDHYEGNLTLSQLELVILALKALSSRQTSPYLRGDLAYVLMGLLRRRPHVDSTDSEFQAFARLSLANDSNQLLERLLCIQPVSSTQPWYITDDAFKVNLWDIEPTCQIASICDNDTVVLDGCFGAAIQYEYFLPPYHERSASWKRTLAELSLRIFTILFAFSLILLIFIPGFPIFIGLLIISLPVFLLSPWLTRICFGGKIWNVAPYLFGFEGYLDIDTIESHIYGFPASRLRWSPAGSNISRHKRNEHGECEGEDPTNDPRIAEKVRRMRDAGAGDMRMFTLVDTKNGLVTLFESVRPPVAALFCAQEGGMQRAVMVSLDWKTSTLYRETVLRMPTVMLEDMWRVDRVRVGLNRTMDPVVKREQFPGNPNTV